MPGNSNRSGLRRTKRAEEFVNPLGGQFRPEELVTGARIGDDANIRVIAFIAATRVSNFAEPNDANRHITPQSDADLTETVAGTSSLGTSVGQ